MAQSKMLAVKLLEMGLLSQVQLEEALAEQQHSGEKLSRILVRRGYITEQQLLAVLESICIPRAI